MIASLKPQKVRGIALAVALSLSVVLLILAITYLDFVGRDYYLTGKHYTDLQAYYLAETCLDYYANTGFSIPNGQLVLVFPGINPKRYSCVVSRETTGELSFQGRVTNEVGALISARTIQVP